VLPIAPQRTPDAIDEEALGLGDRLRRRSVNSTLAAHCEVVVVTGGVIDVLTGAGTIVAAMKFSFYLPRFLSGRDAMKSA
jgi:hypothetical protein